MATDTSVDGGAVAGQALEDLLGAFGPHEWTRVLVPGGGPSGDVSVSSLTLRCAERLSFFGAERGEPSLDQIHPGPIGRRELEVEPTVAQQPFVARAALMGAETVQDDMHVGLAHPLAVVRRCIEAKAGPKLGKNLPKPAFC